jgi:hypothetical protein
MATKSEMMAARVETLPKEKREIGQIYEITEGERKGDIVIWIDDKEDQMFVLANVVQLAGAGLYAEANRKRKRR